MARFEQPVRTVFGGVSRQPPVVRRDNQVEEGDNALFSVVTGGFEKRPATQYIAALTALDATKEYAVHAINRDPTDQLMLTVADGDIKLHNAITGAAVTINVQDQDHYLAIEADSGSVATIVSSEEMAYAAGETEVVFTYASTHANPVITLEGSTTGAFGGEETTLDTLTGTSDSGTVAISSDNMKFLRVKVTTNEAAQSFTLYATAKMLSYIVDIVPEEIAFVTIADFTFITNRSIITRMREASAADGIDFNLQTFADLADETPSDNDVARIFGNNSDNFEEYYVQWDSTLAVWEEVVKGGQHNTFDATTMPHVLIKQTDGTYNFQQATYSERLVGDETVVPQPTFIGRTINDLFWFANRVGFVSDEHTWMAAITQGQTDSGSINWWPSKAFTVLDTDPIDRTAGTERVAVLRWATPFRKLLFATADEIQFELTAGNDAALTPTNVKLDASTFYSASPNVKPINLGDVLYFGSLTPRAAAIFEYFFEDGTLSNTAADITKHVVDYIPSEIIQMATDPLSGTLFALSSGENNSVFVYTTFWDGNEKVQSSWSKWKFGAAESDAFIHGMAVLSNFLVLVIERADGIFLEQIPVTQEAPDTDLVTWVPQMDQRTVLTGVYNSGTDLTTWTTVWDNNDDVEIITGGSGFATGLKGARLTINSYTAATTVTVKGDWSAGPSYVGRPYTMSVELSRTYARDNQGTPDVNGTVKLQRAIFNYTTTGYFKVAVDPGFSRDIKTYEFTGRVLGRADNTVGEAVIVPEGQFRCSPMEVDARDAVITVSNDTPFPSIISSYTLIGTQDSDIEADRTPRR